MAKQRRADEKVSILSAEQKHELEKEELNIFVKYSAVEAASCQGVSPSALMNMRWVVAVQGSTHQKF